MEEVPRMVVDVPSLETFKVSLDKTPCALIELKMSLLIAGGLDCMNFKEVCQPKLFPNSMIMDLKMDGGGGGVEESIT